MNLNLIRLPLLFVCDVLNESEQVLGFYLFLVSLFSILLKLSAVKNLLLVKFCTICLQSLFKFDHGLYFVVSIVSNADDLQASALSTESSHFR